MCCCFFLTKSDLHKHSLKCLIYSTIRVAKSKDQLRDYSEADLRLCFRIIMQIDFFIMRRLKSIVWKCLVTTYELV